MPDPLAVQSMFGRIARRYDLANRLLSGGLDVRWRRRLVRGVRRHEPREILDLATGSGDVAFALSREMGNFTKVIGMDFCQPMLDRALDRQHREPSKYQNVDFQLGDSLSIPLPDESCDAVTIAFGLRNLADRNRGLREMLRVLRPGGWLHVLEFSQPKRWLRPVYYFYLRSILPRVAGVVTGDRSAYEYLNDSISEFPGLETLTREIAAAGFQDVHASPMTFGIVALHEARK